MGLSEVDYVETARQARMKRVARILKEAEMPLVNLSFRVPEQTHKKLKLLALKSDTSIRDVIIELIDNRFEGEKKAIGKYLSELEIK